MEKSKMGAGARIEKAILDISGSKMSAVIKDKIGRGVNMTKKKARSVAGGTRSRADNLIFRFKLMIYNSIATLLTFGLIVALSLFFYGTFYYAFMPLQVHEQPINLQFLPCVDNPGMCSYPNASIELNNKIKLMTGQPYSISLRLEVPESTINQNLGMFMSCLSVELRDKTREFSCQSSILEFRSPFLIYLETMAFSPFLVSGTSSQKQYVTINFFQKFYDDPHNQATRAHIEIQSKFIQVYRSTVLIHAEFSGLRHILYHHPWISTCVGVAGNFILLSTILLLSWSRLFNDPLELDDESLPTSGLLGDIMSEESDLSYEEDDVFNFVKDDDVVPYTKGLHEKNVVDPPTNYSTPTTIASDSIQPNQPPFSAVEDVSSANRCILDGDMDNRINTLVENIQ